MAASAMALLAGCPADAVVSALKDFEGLEHCLELVREFEGVDYINDSKGTNADAVVKKSLESFSRPVILIAGGRDKDGDFSLLSSLIKSRVKTRSHRRGKGQDKKSSWRSNRDHICG